jgi:hypothetical protein
VSKALEELVQEALTLARSERMALAAFLLELDDTGGEEEVEAAYEQEIRARIRAVDDGTATGISHEDVMRKAESLSVRAFEIE